MNKIQSFPVAPLSKSSVVLQIIIIAITPGILFALLIIPELRSDLIISIPIAVLLLLTLGGMWFFSGRRRIELNQQQLEIASTFYTRKVDVNELDLKHARILRLDEHKDQKPVLKTNGYAIPGFQSGHFRSTKWKKMFCLVTNPNVVILPLKNSEAVIMLSPVRPRALLDALNDARS